MRMKSTCFHLIKKMQHQKNGTMFRVSEKIKSGAVVFFQYVFGSMCNNKHVHECSRLCFYVQYTKKVKIAVEHSPFLA